jgi:ribonuclease I
MVSRAMFRPSPPQPAVTASKIAEVHPGLALRSNDVRWDQGGACVLTVNRSEHFIQALRLHTCMSCRTNTNKAWMKYEPIEEVQIYHL